MPPAFERSHTFTHALPYLWLLVLRATLVPSCSSLPFVLVVLRLQHAFLHLHVGLLRCILVAFCVPTFLLFYIWRYYFPTLRCHTVYHLPRYVVLPLPFVARFATPPAPHLYMRCRFTRTTVAFGWLRFTTAVDLRRLRFAVAVWFATLRLHICRIVVYTLLLLQFHCGIYTYILLT